MSSKPKKLRFETVRKTVKGKVFTSVLLRQSFRKDGKVFHETVSNLTPDVIDFMKRRLVASLLPIRRILRLTSLDHCRMVMSWFRGHWILCLS